MDLGQVKVTSTKCQLISFAIHMPALKLLRQNIRVSQAEESLKAKHSTLQLKHSIKFIIRQQINFQLFLSSFWNFIINLQSLSSRTESWNARIAFVVFAYEL
jgi:hypothetical protein